MRRVAALRGEASIEVRRAISVNLVLAVRLVVVLALTALEARPDLGADTDALADLGEGHLGTDLEDLADDLVADSQRVRAAAPFAADGVQVAGADTAALNLDVDVVVAKGARGPRVLFKVLPFLGAGGLEARELFGVRHFGVVCRVVEDL